ncbi:cupin domain-containing protein [bacterium]|nr:cupin domain-containing protein [bacterium]
MTERTPDQLAEIALLALVGGLPADEAREWEHLLLLNDPATLAAANRAEEAIRALTDSVQAISPSPRVREDLLSRVKQYQHEVQTIVRATPTSWQATGIAGIAIRRLGVDRFQKRETFLLRFAPGAVLPDHPHHQREECLVLEGRIQTRGLELNVGDYLTLEGGTMHGESVSPEGCVVLITAGLAEEIT